MSDDDWQNDPLMKSAALEGIASNEAMPMSDRLACARQAAEMLRAEVHHLRGRMTTLSQQLSASEDAHIGVTANNKRLREQLARLKPLIAAAKAWRANTAPAIYAEDLTDDDRALKTAVDMLGGGGGK